MLNKWSETKADPPVVQLGKSMSIQAQGKEKECAVCHTERQFCISCHRDNQLLPHNHVAGWALPNVGGRHKDEALNDIESCMACHEQNAEQICNKCHGK